MIAKLTGKVALITGATAGIGKACARALAKDGARLVLTGRRQDRLEELKQEAEKFGTQAISVAGDAREESTATKTVEAAIQTFGQIDILVNNAGAGNYKNLVETSAEEYDELMDTNVRSTFLFTRHTVPVMLQRKQGTILTISSMAGVYGFAGEAVYCATKFAQVGFAQALDKELRIHGIKVGVICPGGVKTEFAIGRDAPKKASASRICLSRKMWQTLFYWPANNPRARELLKSKCAQWQNRLPRKTG